MKTEAKQLPDDAGRKRQRTWWLAALAAVSLFPAVAQGQAAGPMPLPQTWWGDLIPDTEKLPGKRAIRFELTVSVLSSDKEAAELAAELKVGGQAGLRNAMFRLQPKGWIRLGNQAATSIGVIRAADLPDGRRVVRIYSDRPLRYYDSTDPVGSTAHPFAYMEISVDSSGRGEGIMIAAASLNINEEGLSIASAGSPILKVVDVSSDSPPKPAAKR